jgi:hypothetical protein
MQTNYYNHYGALLIAVLTNNAHLTAVQKYISKFKLIMQGRTLFVEGMAGVW